MKQPTRSKIADSVLVVGMGLVVVVFIYGSFFMT